MIIGTALIAGISGYLFGIGSGLGIFPNPFVAKEPRKRGIANYDDEEESEEEDIDASILDHAPNWANGFEADKRDGLRVTSAAKTKEVKKEGGVKKEPGIKQEPGSEWEDTGEECKMVLVVRTDLGMTKGKSIFSLLPLHLRNFANDLTGKIAAQCGHATLACYKHFLKHDPKSKILRRWERGGQMKIALQAKSEEDLDTLQATAISLGLVAEVIADAGRTQIASGSHTVLGIGPGPASVINQVTGTLKLL